MTRARDLKEIREAAQHARSVLGVSDQTAPDMVAVLRKLTKILPKAEFKIIRDASAPNVDAWVSSNRLSVKESVFHSLLYYGDARARWTIAHELGHMVLGHQGRLFRMAPHAAASWRRAEESEANTFAAYFLVPDHLAHGKTADEIRRYFQVSSKVANKRIVELKSSDELPLAPAARARADVVSELAQHGFSERELSELVVPKRTLARRRAENELLTVEETDKALRLKRIATLAEKIFGEPAKAHRWMRKPKRSLSGDTPLDYLASENGARIVEEMLGRIEHGIYA